MVCVVCSTGGEWIADVLSTYTPTSDTDTPVNEVSQESSLLQHIQDNFATAATLYATDVGRFSWVESLQMHVAFFLFNNATDPRHTARNHLPDGPQIHKCDIDSICFTQTHFGRASSTAFERDREFSNLCSFLGSISYGPVYVFPSESILCADSGISVCDRVRECLSMSRSCASSTAHTNKAASLVFVRRTNSSFVIHSELLRRVLTYAQGELLTVHHSVYVITDVGHDVSGITTFQGLLEPSSSVHVAVYSGAKPMFSPISCVVIALHSRLSPSFDRP